MKSSKYEQRNLNTFFFRSLIIDAAQQIYVGVDVVQLLLGGIMNGEAPVVPYGSSCSCSSEPLLP
jgi:hypothetical protein